MSVALFENHRKEHVYDSLTGAVNKDYLTKYAQQLIDQGTIFSFYFVDFDNFKKVNDSLGHLVGDQLLKDAVKILQNSIGEAGTIGRYGGDEFAIITPNIATYDDVWHIARKFNQDLRASSFPYLEGVLPNNYVTITTGISRFPIDAHNLNDLIALADKALYRGKTKGRNCFIIYNKALHGNIDVQQKRAALSIPGMIDYLFAQFQLSDKEEALSKVCHLFGNYFSDTNIFLIGKTGYTHIYSSVEGKKESIPILPNDALFEENESFHIFYYSQLKEDDFSKIIKNIFEERRIRSSLLVKIRLGEEPDPYLLMESDNEKIWSDNEIALFQTLANLYAMVSKRVR